MEERNQNESSATEQFLAQLSQRVTRRKFLRYIGGMAAGVTLIGAGGLTYATKIEPDWVDITRMPLTLPGLEAAFEGFRLVQFSDIHISEAMTADEVAHARELILSLKPDLVAITGDFVDERRDLHQSVADLAGVLLPLAEQVQVLAVLGNHDYRMGAQPIRQMLKQIGILELNNSAITLQRGKSLFTFAGVDDILRGKPRLNSALEKVPATGAAVLLAHEPDYAYVSAKTGRFDLQISGHSHGGQVVLPFVGPPILPQMGQKYPAGLYSVGRMLQYTNRGLGTTSPHVRFNCRPEITLFVFEPGEG